MDICQILSQKQKKFFKLFKGNLSNNKHVLSELKSVGEIWS